MDHQNFNRLGYGAGDEFDQEGHDLHTSILNTLSNALENGTATDQTIQRYQKLLITSTQELTQLKNNLAIMLRGEIPKTRIFMQTYRPIVEATLNPRGFALVSLTNPKGAAQNKQIICIPATIQKNIPITEIRKTVQFELANNSQSFEIEILAQLQKYHSLTFQLIARAVTKLVLPDTLTELGVEGLRDFWRLKTFKLPAGITCLQQNMIPTERADKQQFVLDLNMCRLVKLVSDLLGYEQKIKFICTNVELLVLDIKVTKFDITLTNIDTNKMKQIFVGRRVFTDNHFMLFFVNGTPPTVQQFMPPGEGKAIQFTSAQDQTHTKFGKRLLADKFVLDSELYADGDQPPRLPRNAFGENFPYEQYLMDDTFVRVQPITEHYDVIKIQTQKKPSNDAQKLRQAAMLRAMSGNTQPPPPPVKKEDGWF